MRTIVLRRPLIVALEDNRPYQKVVSLQKSQQIVDTVDSRSTLYICRDRDRVNWTIPYHDVQFKFMKNAYMHSNNLRIE